MLSGKLCMSGSYMFNYLKILYATQWSQSNIVLEVIFVVVVIRELVVLVK